MQRDQKFLLGVGIDNVNLQETILQIEEMIKEYPQDKRPRYIATVNTDFINNAQCWNFPYVYNAELLNQLRRSSLDVCDGVPLLWLSKLLSSPLKERVAGASLILPLAKALGNNNRSIFLLGGNETDAQKTAETMRKECPGLKIAGIACPKVTTEGVGLIDEPEKDTLLIEQINNAAPHLLLINFGNPKQELWFARISAQLKVPVSIGIGGCFSFFSGSITRAPLWMQNIGLEWLYRLYQEPKRLWKRYLIGIPHFIYMSFPAITYHQICNAMYNLFYKFFDHPLTEMRTRLYVSSTRTISVLELPSKLDISYETVCSEQVDQAFAHDHIVIDFSRVRHMTIEGISFLVGLWMRAKKQEKELSGLRLNGDMKLLLKVHRAWDILSAHQHQTVNDLLTTLQQARYNTLYDTIHQDKMTVHISFFGKLDNRQDYNRLLSRFEPILKGRNCTLDLAYCTTIEGRGFSFLLYLKKYIQQQKFNLHLCCANDEVLREFQRAKLDKEFEWYPCRP